MSIVAAAELSIWVSGGAHLRRVVSGAYCGGGAVPAILPRAHPAAALRVAAGGSAPSIPPPLCSVACAMHARQSNRKAGLASPPPARKRGSTASDRHSPAVRQTLQLSQRKAVTPDLANDR